MILPTLSYLLFWKKLKIDYKRDIPFLQDNNINFKSMIKEKKESDWLFEIFWDHNFSIHSKVSMIDIKNCLHNDVCIDDFIDYWTIFIDTNSDWKQKAHV